MGHLDGMTTRRSSLADRTALPLLRPIRRVRNISQHELARRAGVARNTIGNVERGQYAPRPRTAERIARALDLPLGVVFPAAPGPGQSDA